MSVQSIRASQLILTYGPGAVIEAPGGPGVMRTIESSGVFSRATPSDFEIADSRLSRRLSAQGGAVGLAAIPTNPELGQTDSRGPYTANVFPMWSLCVDHLGYAVIYQYNESAGGCPECGTVGNAARTKSRIEAIRFVQACDAGHLDDLDWPRLIDHSNQSCNPSHLIWRGTSSSLRYAEIECPRCGSHSNMALIYGTPKRCTGRMPERDSTRPGCDRRATVVQRNASNLRMTELVSSLSIPPIDTPLHGILSRGDVQLLIVGRTLNSKLELLQILENAASRNLINSSLRDLIDSYSEIQVLEALEDIAGVLDAPIGDDQFRQAELVQLRRAAEFGSPPPERQFGPNPWFEVQASGVRTHTLQNGLTLRVTPVTRLRVVIAQIGYKRIDPQAGTTVPSLFTDPGGREWIPAVAVSGEGLFIDIPDLSDPLKSTEQAHVADWRTLRSNLHDNDFIASTEVGPDAFDPSTVWWHSLSHRLMNALSLDSGYSSAALRERIYVDRSDNNEMLGAGVLIYTSQPGGDGTLGGLVASADCFDSVMTTAVGDIEYCSNDPLCLDNTVGSERVNGAACYACLFTSETSCELRNLGLDRHLLIGI